jgi:regulatory protein
VADLAREGLQSDERYTESYIHHRISRGYGPVYIRRELQQRGVPGEMVEHMFASLDVDWSRAIETVREKKFGRSMPADFKERSRQSRFLQYRGFSGEQISRLFRPTE